MAFTMNTYVASQTLAAASLNADNAAVIAVLSAGITADNIAPDGISAGTLIADDVVGESHVDWAGTVDGVRGMQIGKEVNTYDRHHVMGTAAVASLTDANTQTVTITFNDDVIIPTAGLVFAATPHITADILTTDTAIGVFKISANSAGATFNVINTETLSTAQVLYWQAVGNV